ncbi:hypothetical protein BJY00DRAFT_295975 [Aspergillus carlsbadensis]|nr:hypothetical protein BJY00DRAFT_295975 [Aspergillus carlsbadensis]
MAPKLSIPVYTMQKFVFTDFLSTGQNFQITHLQVAPPILIMLDKRPETCAWDTGRTRRLAENRRRDARRGRPVLGRGSEEGADEGECVAGFAGGAGGCTFGA